MIALTVVVALLGQPYQDVVGPDGPFFNNPALNSRAFFEFAPLDGAGMTAACACVNPTGAKGEALTFARASSGTCIKGSTTSLANGDMVTCASNQMRVMPGGDGSGARGALIEATRTNLDLRSQEFDNAAVWVPSNSGSSNPIVTANAADAPDGTHTAERVQIPAISAGWSLLQQGFTAAAAQHSGSVYVKGNGQSGTIVQFYGGHTCVTCAYNPNTWTYCPQNGVSLNGATNHNFGQDIVDCGAGSFGAQDFFLSSSQSEVGLYATSYIFTAGASVTRAADLADVAISLPALIALSVANTIILPTGFASPVLTGTLGDGAPGAGAGSTNFFTSQVTGGNDQAITAGVGLPTSFTGAAVSAGLHRYAVFHTGARLSNCIDGVCGAGAAGAFASPTFTRFRIGAYQSTVQVADAVTKLVCVDMNYVRCR